MAGRVKVSKARRTAGVAILEHQRHQRLTGMKPPHGVVGQPPARNPVQNSQRSVHVLLLEKLTCVAHGVIGESLKSIDIPTHGRNGRAFQRTNRARHLVNVPALIKAQSYITESLEGRVEGTVYVGIPAKHRPFTIQFKAQRPKPFPELLTIYRLAIQKQGVETPWGFGTVRSVVRDSRYALRREFARDRVSFQHRLDVGRPQCIQTFPKGAHGVPLQLEVFPANDVSRSPSKTRSSPPRYINTSSTARVSSSLKGKKRPFARAKTVPEASSIVASAVTMRR